jgi:Ca-activated chloride channel family protein
MFALSFADPAYLVAVLIAPALLLAYAIVQRRKTRYAVRFTNLNLLANVVEQTPSVKRHVAPVLFTLSLAVLLVAIAEPQNEVRVPKEEATVVLIMDVSGSMQAEDVEPTRMEAAKSAATAFLDVLPPKFRVGVVQFSDFAEALTLPTDQRDQVAAAIATMEPLGGTAMGDGIIRGLEVGGRKINPDGTSAEPTPDETDTETTAETDPPLVLLLLSDGANTAGTFDPIDAADLSSELGVPIFTIALGTDDGVITIDDPDFGSQTLQVPPDEATLEEVADRTGGEFFSAPDEEELQAVYSSLGSKIGFTTEEQPTTRWYVAVGVGILILAAGASLTFSQRLP